MGFKSELESTLAFRGAFHGLSCRCPSALPVHFPGLPCQEKGHLRLEFLMFLLGRAMCSLFSCFVFSILGGAGGPVDPQARPCSVPAPHQTLEMKWWFLWFIVTAEGEGDKTDASFIYIKIRIRLGPSCRNRELSHDAKCARISAIQFVHKIETIEGNIFYACFHFYFKARRCELYNLPHHEASNPFQHITQCDRFITQPFPLWRKSFAPIKKMGSLALRVWGLFCGFMAHLKPWDRLACPNNKCTVLAPI